MAVQPKPFRSEKIPGASDRDPFPESSFSPAVKISENLDEKAILSSLKQLIAAGNHGLDPILGTITDVARQMTGASGAALAMWKEGAMMCRARSGDIAPVLGAQLSADTGISGECLRTGKLQHCADTEDDPLVDLEVCRSLGLRSIAVLPIRGWRGINGILEVFSTSPTAFTGQHIAFLQKLALLAERARTSQSESASSGALHLPPEVDGTHRSRVLPVSDRGRNAALASRGTRSRPFVLGAIGLIVISLLAWAIWRGSRGLERADGKAQPAPYPASPASTAPADTAAPPAAIPPPPGGDTMGKEKPGSELISLSLEKPSAVSPVKLASKVDAIAGTKTQPGRAPLERSPSAPGIAPNVVIKYELPNSQPRSISGSKMGPPPDSRSNAHPDANTPVEPQSIPAGPTSSSALNEVLSARVSLPGFSVPVSQGVSGGQRVYRVPPVYPARARALRLEGKVVLAAVIMEDGTLRDVKVIDGPPLLAQSAVEAVKHWRYKPYELDGKPVKNEIRINVDFKFPESSH